MRMIPSVPYKTPSNAERRVFDRLKKICNEEGFTAYHSMTLIHHGYKRFGEIDFLIIGPKGIFVLEIKGGGVGRNSNGDWIFKSPDPNKKEGKSREGPFRQAESAMQALVNTTLKEYFSESIINQFVIGYGVITPDAELPDTSEWDPAIHAGKKKFRNFERWFKGLVHHWRSRDRKAAIVESSVLKEIKNFLRPNFDVMTSLYAHAQDAREMIISLTKDQMSFADAVEVNDQVLCSGSAGTGKTLLALEAGRRWAMQDNMVLLVCYSPWLKNYLKTHLAVSNVLVTTLKSLPIAVKRSGIDKFDALIVDEGQDLMQWDSLDKLGKYIQGGLEKGKWCFFYDINNQANLFDPFEPDALELLNSYKPARIPLKKNCRNTKVILERIQSDIGADMGIGGAGVGPEVKDITVNSNDESATILAEFIDELIEEEGLSWRDLTILSPQPLAESSIKLLDKKYHRHLIELDEHSMRDFPPQKMSFAQIANFKGLENEAVILIDMPNPTTLDDLANLAEYYVAMSRARVFLQIIYID